MSTNLVTPSFHIEYGESSCRAIEAPTLDVEALLTGPVTPDLLTEINSKFSPTPGDPYNVRTIDGVDYVKAESLLMQRSLYEAAYTLNMLHTDEIIPIIDGEVDTQHERRCNANKDALVRLLGILDESGTKIVPKSIADLLWRYRIGRVTPSEGAEILMRFPEMGGVEAAKIMDPFNFNSIRQLDEYARLELLKLRPYMLSQGIDVKIDFARKGPNISTILDTAKVGPNSDRDVCILVVKQTVGEARADGMPQIQLKRKISYSGLPPDEGFMDGKKNITKIEGIQYDVRPIGGSYYWCTTEKELMIGGSALTAARG